MRQGYYRNGARSKTAPPKTCRSATPEGTAANERISDPDGMVTASAYVTQMVAIAPSLTNDQVSRLKEVFARSDKTAEPVPFERLKVSQNLPEVSS